MYVKENKCCGHKSSPRILCGHAGYINVHVDHTSIIRCIGSYNRVCTNYVPPDV